MKKAKKFWQVCNNLPLQGVYSVPAGNTNPMPGRTFLYYKETNT